MNRKADEHYHKTLLKNFGFLPWKKLITTRDELLNNAELWHKRNLQDACFRSWLAHTRSECERRNQLASTMRKTLLLRSALQSWKKVKF
jgi:transposase